MILATVMLPHAYGILGDVRDRPAVPTGVAFLGPAVVPVCCGYCRRQLRKLTLDGSGRLLMLGSLSTGRSGASMSKPGERRAAWAYDASPDGWHTDPADPLSRYGFICRHKSRSLPNLDRPYRAEVLRDRYEQARRSGEPIYLT